jgi:hypothetical protein
MALTAVGMCDAPKAVHTISSLLCSAMQTVDYRELHKTIGSADTWLIYGLCVVHLRPELRTGLVVCHDLCRQLQEFFTFKQNRITI